MTETTVVAITGPPAAGKSTITEMLADMGVLVIDTGKSMRSYARSQLDDPDEDAIWEFVSEQRDEIGDHAPTQIAVEEASRFVADVDTVAVAGLREQAEVEWLRENVGPTLVVRVDADSYARTQRYVDDRIEDRGIVDQDRIDELREELYEREYREMPYPDHDVTIRNEDSVRPTEIMRRLENLIEVVES